MRMYTLADKAITQVQLYNYTALRKNDYRKILFLQSTLFKELYTFLKITHNINILTFGIRNNTKILR